MANGRNRLYWLFALAISSIPLSISFYGIATDRRYLTIFSFIIFLFCLLLSTCFFLSWKTLRFSIPFMVSFLKTISMTLSPFVNLIRGIPIIGSVMNGTVKLIFWTWFIILMLSDVFVRKLLKSIVGVHSIHDTQQLHQGSAGEYSLVNACDTNFQPCGEFGKVLDRKKMDWIEHPGRNVQDLATNEESVIVGGGGGGGGGGSKSTTMITDGMTTAPLSVARLEELEKKLKTPGRAGSDLKSLSMVEWQQVLDRARGGGGGDLQQDDLNDDKVLDRATVLANLENRQQQQQQPQHRSSISNQTRVSHDSTTTATGGSDGKSKSGKGGGGGGRVKGDRPKYSQVIATTLAMVSKLVYEDVPIIRHELELSGYDLNTFRPIAYRNTVGFIVQKGRNIILVFRGTDPLNLQNAWTDIQSRLVPIQTFGDNPVSLGKCHRGMYNALGKSDDFLLPSQELLQQQIAKRRQERQKLNQHGWYDDGNDDDEEEEEEGKEGRYDGYGQFDYEDVEDEEGQRLFQEDDAEESDYLNMLHLDYHSLPLRDGLSNRRRKTSLTSTASKSGRGPGRTSTISSPSSTTGSVIDSTPTTAAAANRTLSFRSDSSTIHSTINLELSDKSVYQIITTSLMAAYTLIRFLVVGLFTHVSDPVDYRFAGEIRHLGAFAQACRWVDGLCLEHTEKQRMKWEKMRVQQRQFKRQQLQQQQQQQQQSGGKQRRASTPSRSLSRKTSRSNSLYNLYGQDGSSSRPTEFSYLHGEGGKHHDEEDDDNVDREAELMSLAVAASQQHQRGSMASFGSLSSISGHNENNQGGGGRRRRSSITNQHLVNGPGTRNHRRRRSGTMPDPHLHHHHHHQGHHHSHSQPLNGSADIDRYLRDNFNIGTDNSNQQQQQPQQQQQAPPKMSKPKKLRFFITGHSLGGGLATMFLAKMVQCRSPLLQVFSGLYTYGHPRIGDQDFSQAFGNRLSTKMFHHVHNNDLISRLPFWGAFSSPPGNLVFIDSHRVLTVYPPAPAPKGMTKIKNGTIPLATTTTLDQEDGQERVVLLPVPVRPISFLHLSGVLNLAVLKRMRHESWLRILERFILPFFMNDHFPSDYVKALAEGKIEVVEMKDSDWFGGTDPKDGSGSKLNHSESTFPSLVTMAAVTAAARLNDDRMSVDSGYDGGSSQQQQQQQQQQQKQPVSSSSFGFWKSNKTNKKHL